MKRILFLFLGILGRMDFLLAVEPISQDATHQNFEQEILCKAYDRFTGNLYVGAKGGAAYNYSIAKAGREDILFSGLAANLLDKNIEALSLAYSNGLNSAATHIVARVPFGKDPNHLKILDLSDNSVKNSADLKLGNNVTNASRLGAVTTGIVNLASGSAAHAFVRTSASVDLDQEGSGGGSIDAISILNMKTNLSLNSITLRANTAVVNRVKNSAGGIRIFKAPVTVNDMCWDNDFQILYIAIRAEVQDPNKGTQSNIGFAIAKGLVNSVDEKISLQNIVDPSFNPDTAPGGNVGNTYISTIVPSGKATTERNIYKVRTMKTSPGLNYLIISTNLKLSGKNNYIISALRLAQQDATNIRKGDVVKADGSALGDNFNPLTFGALSQVVVGGDGVPMENNQVSDMEVIGDTVYISLDNQKRAANDDPGIWASTAMFDNGGVIIGWTKWERVFPSQANNADWQDYTKFFAVDALSGLLWQVRWLNGDTPKIVERANIQTIFTDAVYTTSIQKMLNRDLPDGCTCVLDLPQGTPLIGKGTNLYESLVLFGGIEKAVFARTSYGDARGVSFRFDKAENYLMTNLAGAGVVRCLGFSRNTTNATKGYFFAGTDTGLWVHAASAGDNAGFNNFTDGYGALNAAPFDAVSSFVWMPMVTDKITGPVTAIESNGTDIFVVEQDVKTVGGIVSKLWKITLADDVAHMTPELIAQSGSGDLPINTIFTGLKLVTNATGADHFGVISTNEGLYYSSKILATMLTTDNWTLLDTANEKKAYHSIFAPKRVVTTTVANDGGSWKVVGINLADDSSGKKYYQNSQLQQFNFNQNPPAYGQIDYTNKSLSTGMPLTYLDRTTNFWTDGARRFYTRFNPAESVWNAFRSLPFEAAEWNMSESYAPDALTSVPRIYWIENISALGIILMGTDTGVVAIE